MTTLNLKHHKKTTILKCSLMLFLNTNNTTINVLGIIVLSLQNFQLIFQTEDMSGPLTPSIAADFLSYILGLLQEIFISSEVLQWGKTL